MPSDSIPDAALGSKGQKIHSSRLSAADEVSLVTIMADSGVKPKMKILYVSDYIEPRSRLLKTQKLFQDVSRLLPSWEVEFALSEGPFSDDEGICAHFDKGKTKLTPQKLILETKKDLLISVAQLLRNISIHKPDVILGEGQGGIIALAAAKPFQVEVALQARNVQRSEAEYCRGMGPDQGRHS